MSGPGDEGRGGGAGAGGPRAMVLGCSGPVLTETERRFFQDTDPLGFILFARNCVTPDQVRALVTDLRDSVGRADACVLIDQEGGPVARLKPPHWRAAPAAARFAELAKPGAGGAERAADAARLNARLIAAELADLGITVNCAPVLDVPQPGADAIIGERAAGDTPALAARLGRAACEGFLDGGVLPVLKHIPGHGRATVDSHLALPVVDASWEDLDEVDFAPFRAMNTMPWAMTAHVVYRAVDDSRPATTSAPVIEMAIRGAIRFDGVLISDDLSMQALKGGLDRRADAALAAGCDLVLHCNGDMGEMEAVAAACSPLSEAARARLGRAESMRRPPQPLDREDARARLEELLEGTP